MKRKSIQVGDVITDDIMEKDHSDDKDKKTPVYKNVFISTAYCPYCDQILKDVPESVSGGLYYRHATSAGPGGDVKQDELNYLLIVGGSTLAQAALFCLAYAFPGTNGENDLPTFCVFLVALRANRDRVLVQARTKEPTGDGRLIKIKYDLTEFDGPEGEYIDELRAQVKALSEENFYLKNLQRVTKIVAFEGPKDNLTKIKVLEAELQAAYAKIMKLEAVIRQAVEMCETVANDPESQS